MLDACLLWGSIGATTGAFAGAFYAVTSNEGVADSAILMLLGLGLIAASYIVRKRSANPTQL